MGGCSEQGRGMLTVFFALVLILGAILFFLLLLAVPALIIVGVVYFSLSDTRQKLINEFNQDVDDWTNQYLHEMKSVFEKNGSSPISNSFGILEPNNVMDVSLEDLRDPHDDPEVKSWEEYYFALEHTFLQVEPSSDPPTIYIDFTTPDDSLDEGYKNFHVSKTVITRVSHSQSYTYAKTKCKNEGGVYYPNFLVGDNCYWYYVVDRVCVLLNPRTLKFDKMSKDATGNGCNYREQFEVRNGDYYSPSFYQSTTSVQDYYNITVKYEVRSVHDPEVKLSLITQGKNSFGTSSYSHRQTAIICTSVGGGLCCLLLILPFLLFLTYLCIKKSVSV